MSSIIKMHVLVRMCRLHETFKNIHLGKLIEMPVDGKFLIFCFVLFYDVAKSFQQNAHTHIHKHLFTENRGFYGMLID